MEDTFDIWGYVQALKRRWWLVILIGLVGSSAAIGVAALLPPVYQSTAKILIESQQIPDDLARSTVTSSAAERLELIKQRLTTRDNLLDVIERLGLFAERVDLTPTQKVDKVRKAASIKSISLGGGRRSQGTVSAFTISYQAENPNTAAKVANEFVAIVLEQNLRSRSQRATETHTFFRDEVSRLATSLLSLEAEIASFKNQNAGALPDNLNFRHSELNSLDERILQREQQLLELQQQGRELAEAIKSGRTSAVAERQQTQEERDLAELRRSLLQKEAVFAATHPEIRNLKARIAALETAVAGTAAVQNDADGIEAAQPVGSLAEQQLRLLEDRMELLVGQLSSFRERRDELAESINKTPKVEMDLNAYSRRYEDLQTQYDLAVRKQAEAATGEKLEVNRQAERFEIIEQARVSEEPVAPPRKKIALAGVGGSVALGVGVVLLLEMLFGSIHTVGDLERRLQLRPLGAIPYIRTPDDKWRFTLRWLILGGLIAGLVGGALWAVDQYYLPLQLIFEKAIERANVDALLRLLK